MVDAHTGSAWQRLGGRLPWSTMPGANLSVKASLRIAFAAVLAGALVIGVFSLVQMNRLNAS